MPLQHTPLPPAAELWARYSYNPLTGTLHSLKRPSSGRPLGKIRKDGYVQMHLKWCNMHPQAHRVIWKWLHGCDPIDTIDHINRQRSDNKAWNLREATPTLQSRNHSGCKLTVESVATIKKLLREGHSQSEIGREYGVTNRTIHEIAKGRNWADVA